MSNSEAKKNIDDGGSDDQVELPVDSDSDSDMEDTSINIGLNKAGERGSGYHTRNDPSAPFQRKTVTERRGIIEVQCKSREVIHGRLSPDSEENATLLVYDLFLDTTRRSRRIREASLEFSFRSTVPRTPAPEVQAMAPGGRTTLLPTTSKESVTQGGSVNATAGQFVDLGGSMKWEKTVSRTTNDDARVTGNITSDEKDPYSKPTCARWKLYENVSIKSGVPFFLRCAILLNRGYDEENFKCNITIKAEADWKSEFGKLFGSTPEDDPILFDPTLPPTNKLRKEGYDIENLGAIDLDDIADIVFDRTLKKKGMKDVF